MNQIEQWLEQAGELANDDKVDEAAELCSRILGLEPDNHRALYVLGSVMLKVGRNVQAQQFLRRVCELKPRAQQGWGQLSISCAEMHRYEEAITYAERALGIRREVQTLADASFAHTTAGNWFKGMEYAKAALKMEPGNKDATFHLANCLLAQKQWVDGWQGFKISEGSKWRKKFQYGGSTVEWNGEPDAVVMVTGEQGLGDEVMAAGVIPDAVRACRTFIFDCDHRAGELFKRSFEGAIVVPTRSKKTVALPIAPTHHKSLFGLAELFRRNDAEFPRKPYLVANPEYRRMFRALFGNRRTVGLAWSGGYPRTGQVERAAGLAAFLPLVKDEPDTQFISLQYKDDAAEVLDFEQRTGCRIMRLPWLQPADLAAQDIDLLAAMIAELDEVVGVHTTALHLSSALGVPTTTLVHRGSGWRYAPEELLWYPPTTRLWRKDRGESWRECIASLAAHRRDERRRAA